MGDAWRSKACPSRAREMTDSARVEVPMKGNQRVEMGVSVGGSRETHRSVRRTRHSFWSGRGAGQSAKPARKK